MWWCFKLSSSYSEDYIIYIFSSSSPDHHQHETVPTGFYHGIMVSVCLSLFIPFFNDTVHQPSPVTVLVPVIPHLSTSLPAAFSRGLPVTWPEPSCTDVELHVSPHHAAIMNLEIIWFGFEQWQNKSDLMILSTARFCAAHHAVALQFGCLRNRWSIFASTRTHLMGCQDRRYELHPV